MRTSFWKRIVQPVLGTLRCMPLAESLLVMLEHLIGFEFGHRSQSGLPLIPTQRIILLALITLQRYYGKEYHSITFLGFTRPIKVTADQCQYLGDIARTRALVHYIYRPYCLRSILMQLSICSQCPEIRLTHF
jgi:hypothetical protein